MGQNTIWLKTTALHLGDGLYCLNLVERKEERTVNDATVLDDEHHQEGMVIETSSAHNNSIENIKLEEGMTTEAAWIQTVEAPFQDSSSNNISSQDLSDKDYIQDAAIINESTVESEATKLEEHKLVDVTQSVGEKNMPAEEVIVDKEESIANVDEMNSESKSKDTRSNVDEMSENIINTDENTKEEPVKVPEDDNDSITEIQNEDATFPEGKSGEVTNQIDSSSTKIEEKDDLAALQDPAVVHTPFGSSIPVSDVDNMEKEDPKTGTHAKIADQEEEMTVIHPKDGDESLQPEVEPEGEVITEEEVSISMQDDSSKVHKNEEKFQEQGNMSTQTSLIEEEKDRDQNEYQPSLTTGHDSARETQSEPLLIGKSQVTSEGIVTEIAHEERTVEVPSHDSSSNKTSSQDLSEKEHNEGALNDTAIDESKTEGSHINDTAEILSTESEATKLEKDKLIDATQSVGEKDLPAEDSPIVEKAIIYNPDVENEESIAKVDELNSESKSDSEPNLITNEGLSPDSEDREATNNVCDLNMEIEEKSVPEPQTDAIISGDNQVPSESLLAESSSDIIKEMECEDASKAASNTVNTISKECTLNDDDKNEKIEEPASHKNDSTTEIQNEPYFLHEIPTETTDQIDSSSTKIEEKDDLEVLQDIAAVQEPFESSTPVSDVDNMDKEDPKIGTGAKITGQEEMTVIHPKDGDESLQPEVEKNEPEGEVVSKEATIIIQDSSSKEQEIEEKFQVIEHNNSPIDVPESEAVPLPYKISDADQY